MTPDKARYGARYARGLDNVAAVVIFGAAIILAMFTIALVILSGR